MTKETSQSELSLREAGEKYVVLSLREMALLNHMMNIALSHEPEKSLLIIKPYLNEAEELRSRLWKEYYQFKLFNVR